jgi:hypothetical protein
MKVVRAKGTPILLVRKKGRGICCFQPLHPYWLYLREGNTERLHCDVPLPRMEIRHTHRAIHRKQTNCLADLQVQN